mgnify:CR=1 FL=1
MTIDRAIEILNPEHREHYDGLDEVNEACRMGMEALERARWIPCSERVPENDGYVLAIASGRVGNIYLDNAIELGAFDMDEGWMLEMWPEWEDPIVTHWMQLPELPGISYSLDSDDLHDGAEIKLPREEQKQ